MVNNLINEAKLLTEMSIKGNLSQISHKHLFMILISDNEVPIVEKNNI